MAKLKKIPAGHFDSVAKVLVDGLNNLVKKLEDSELADVERMIHLQDLDESTLSRVWQHTKDKDTAFAILTAFRDDKYEESENVRRTKSLAASVRNAGYGHFWLQGYFIENEGTPNEIRVVEDSIFVISSGPENKKLKSAMLTLAKNYEQHSIFFKPEDEDMGYIILTSGKVDAGPLPLNLDQMGIYYSKLTTGSHAGRNFTFESAGEANGLMVRAVKQKEAKKNGFIT